MRHFAIILLSLVAFSLFGAEPDAEPAPISGTLMLHRGAQIPDAIAEKFVAAAGGAGAKIVLLAGEDAPADDVAKIAASLQKHGVVAALKMVSGKDSNAGDLAASLKTCTGVWFGGGSAEKLAAVFAGSAAEAELRAVLTRNGAVGGCSCVAALLSKFVLCAEPEKKEFGTGLDLLPGTVVDLQFDSKDGNPRLLAALGRHSGMVGIGIEDGSTLVLRGRDVTVSGEGVRFCLAPSAIRPARESRLTPAAHYDWIALRRAAIARAGPVFPPAKPDAPVLENGTLVIDGGGLPKDVPPRFIQAAGGPDALILVLPSAQENVPDLSPDDVDKVGEARRMKLAGAKNLKIFHLTSRAQAFDEEKIKILREAKGIWFCGGRQWRYVDLYLGTPVEKLMHDVLKRGGAIGGSSAGATIQGEYLVRGNPLGNLQMMSEGYERGMGFLKGAAIDQHFVRRNRFADMTSLKKAFPQLLGLGIDEGAAVVINGHTLEVIGVKDVAVYDKPTPPAKVEPEYVNLKPGEKYDLKALAKMQP